LFQAATIFDLVVETLMYTGATHLLKSVYSAPKTTDLNNPARYSFDGASVADADAAAQSMIAAARNNSMALILTV
jgi:hypothetical protein